MLWSDFQQTIFPQALFVVLNVSPCLLCLPLSKKKFIEREVHSHYSLFLSTVNFVHKNFLPVEAIVFNTVRWQAHTNSLHYTTSTISGQQPTK